MYKLIKLLKYNNISLLKYLLQLSLLVE